MILVYFFLTFNEINSIMQGFNLKRVPWIQFKVLNVKMRSCVVFSFYLNAAGLVFVPPCVLPVDVGEVVFTDSHTNSFTHSIRESVASAKGLHLTA